MWPLCLLNQGFPCMNACYPIVVIIATSGCRTTKLLQQALPSVLSQSYLPQACIVVDDNESSQEYHDIEAGLRGLQEETAVTLIVTKNSRTRGFSGTGAWNTGLSYAREYAVMQKWEEVYVAILDDDDRWLESHLKLCAERMGDLPDAIFCNLTRVYHEYEDPGKLESDQDLTISRFLYGNPGVQGSNMCFRLSVIEAIGGFDEALRSCTDRDLMIRFLDQFGNLNICVLQEQTVWHDARSPVCVTNNVENKTAGLDTFYMKHLGRFDERVLKQSLARAEKLFSYPHARQIWEAYYRSQEIIAVMMPLRNGADGIRRAVRSVIEQQRTIRPILLFIGDDNSTDHWREEIADLLACTHQIVTLNIDGGSSAKARNVLTEYVLQLYPHTYMLCRLDADDILCSSTVLAEVESLLANQEVRAVLGGNYQIQGGKVVGENRASQAFHDKDYMGRRLLSMAQGDYRAELPSCNLCFRPDAYMPYPMESSGEDHWLVVQMLLKLPVHAFFMASELMYCAYNLDGGTTQANRANNTYINSRKRLYEYLIRSTDR